MFVLDMTQPSIPDLLAGEDLPPPPKQARSREKRRRLVRAALRLFATKGYEGVSVEDIADRAGVALGVFYLHFRSKRQLLLVLMQELLNDLARIELTIGPSSNPRAAIRELFVRAAATDLRSLGAYRAWQEAVIGDSRLARLDARIHDWTTARLTQLLHGLRRLPRARVKIEVDSLARAIDRLMWSLIGEAARQGSDALSQWADTVAHLVYHAVFRDDAARR